MTFQGPSNFTDKEIDAALEAAVAAYKQERLKQAELDLDGERQHKQDKAAVCKAVIAYLGTLGL